MLDFSCHLNIFEMTWKQAKCKMRADKCKNEISAAAGKHVIAHMRFHKAVLMMQVWLTGAMQKQTLLTQHPPHVHAA